MYNMDQNVDGFGRLVNRDTTMAVFHYVSLQLDVTLDVGCISIFVRDRYGLGCKSGVAISNAERFCH